MKICMHNWMRPEPIEVTIKRLVKYGYDGIQIMGEPRKYDLKEVKGLLDQNGIACQGAVSIMLAGRDLIHGDSYYRDMSVAYVKEVIDMIAYLGGSILTLVPSEVGKIVAMSDPIPNVDGQLRGSRNVLRTLKKKGSLSDSNP